MANENRKMSALARFIALAALGVGITLATGLVHGRLTQRWGPPPDLQAAARALAALPKEIGDWQLASEEPLAASVVETLSCAGYVNRRYVNRQSGQTVSIAIIVGPPGPTAVHTPEICYSSRAYSTEDPRKVVRLSDKDGKSHSFWSLVFRSNNPSLDRLQVYYAWRGGGTWTAAKSPRFEFVGQRLLYKLQMAAVVPAHVPDETPDACQEFLTALLQSGWKTSG
jgi:EpsI family protein